MNAYYITFRSVTRAQRGAEILERYGIQFQLRRTPKAIAEQGCGYALYVNSATAPWAVRTLRQNKAAFARIFAADENGPLKEVSL